MRAFAGWTVVTVRGPSMVPTLRDGDFLVVRVAAARRLGARPVRRGDVVVAEIPGRKGLMVKRAADVVEGGWWLLSDNEFVTSDSREFGAVAEERILGRAVVRIRDGGRGFWRVRFRRVRVLGVPPRGLGDFRQGASGL